MLDFFGVSVDNAPTIFLVCFLAFSLLVDPKRRRESQIRLRRRAHRRLHPRFPRSVLPKRAASLRQIRKALRQTRWPRPRAGRLRLPEGGFRPQRERDGGVRRAGRTQRAGWTVAMPLVRAITRGLRRVCGVFRGRSGRGSGAD